MILYKNFLLPIFLVFLFALNYYECTDPFESLLIRFECYGNEQPGCSTDFIDAYPELSKSNSSLTLATTHMYLFTPENKIKPELLHKCANVVPPDTHFNPRCRTELVIPGYLSGICNMAIFREIKNELLKRGCYNVILVDYMWGNSFDFVQTVANIKIVAKQLIKVINILKKKFNLTQKDFVCTGHSLGAHICGIIGQEERISIINGLDPAGITITENTPLNEKLDPGDADCVQVIHTNARQCIPDIGTNMTSGTVDIWPNGGLYQKSCYHETRNAFLKQDFVYGFFNIFVCSHLESLQYYKTSINAVEEKFVAVKCDSYEKFKRKECRDCGRDGSSCIVMGADCCDCLNSKNLSQKKSNFYLDTNINCPYINNTNIRINGFKC